MKNFASVFGLAFDCFLLAAPARGYEIYISATSTGYGENCFLNPSRIILRADVPIELNSGYKTRLEPSSKIVSLVSTKPDSCHNDCSLESHRSQGMNELMEPVH